MMSKEEARATWVELVAASKEYLKLPVEKTPEKVKKKNLTKSSTQEEKDAAKKPKVADASPEPPPCRPSRPLVATRTHPLFPKRYTEELAGLQEIPSREEWDAESLHVIAMDCEMIQTVDDEMALARVSAVEIHKDWRTAEERVVLDTLVMPTTSKDYIVDTRPIITGLNAEDVASKGISKAEAKARFLALLKPHTILIGHALEHDLLAIGVNYSRVIDTALLFSVENCDSRFTHSLSHLSRAVLDVETNRSARQGTHDSIEDASLALRIVRRMLCEPVIMDQDFPIPLPREESGAKRKLFAQRGVMEKVLSTKIAVAEGNLKARMSALKSAPKNALSASSSSSSV